MPSLVNYTRKPKKKKKKITIIEVDGKFLETPTFTAVSLNTDVLVHNW
jgi:hypothetical protein